MDTIDTTISPEIEDHPFAMKIVQIQRRPGVEPGQMMGIEFGCMNK